MSESTPEPADPRIIPLGPEQAAEVLRLDQAAFAFPLSEVDPDLDLRGFEWDRTYAAVRRAAGPHRHATGSGWADGEELAGLMTSYSLDLTVPGPGEGMQSVAMAGLSWVSVHPDHRRRGVLTAMMRHHLHGRHDAAAAGGAGAVGGEPVSGLFASEAAIYQRFGYGASAPSLIMTLPTGAALRPIPGLAEISTQLTGASIDGAVELARDLSHAVAARRPGGVRRPTVAFESLLRDRPERTGGAELNKLIVARRDGEPTGYALLRRKMDWHQGVPSGKAKVLILVGVDAATEHALWSRVLGLDLVTEVETPLLAVDDPLPGWLVDIRAGNAVFGDGLWLRLVDVDRALEARGYAQDCDVVLEVSDGFCPWNDGRWRLTVQGGRGRCSPSTDPADLAVDVQDLATAYLGGTSLAALAEAGLVAEHRPGAVASLSRSLRGRTEPAVPQMF